MKKVRCKKEYGIWYYKKIVPDCYNELDGTLYILCDSNGSEVAEFGTYWHMKHYIETGEII